MVVRINRLWDAEIRAALTHGFQITVKAFILCQEKSDDLPGSIIDSTMKGVFDISPKPLVRRGIDLDELSGMGLTFAPMCAVSDFFLFRAFKTSIFLVYWKEQSRKVEFRNLQRVYL